MDYNIIFDLIFNLAFVFSLYVRKCICLYKLPYKYPFTSAPMHIDKTKVLFTDLNSCIALAIVRFEFPAPRILLPFGQFQGPHAINFFKLKVHSC